MIKYPFLIKKLFLPLSIAIPFSLVNYNINSKDDDHKKNMDKMVNIIQIQRM